MFTSVPPNLYPTILTPQAPRLTPFRLPNAQAAAQRTASGIYLVPAGPDSFTPFTYASRTQVRLAPPARAQFEQALTREADAVVEYLLGNPAIRLGDALQSFRDAIGKIRPEPALALRAVPPYQPDKRATAAQIPAYARSLGQQLAAKLSILGVVVEHEIDGGTYEQAGVWYQLHPCGVYVQRRISARELILGGVVSSKGEYEALLIQMEPKVQAKLARHAAVRQTIGR